MDHIAEFLKFVEHIEDVIRMANLIDNLHYLKTYPDEQ